MEDHVHLLLRVPTSLAPATLVKQVKGASSHSLNLTASPGAGFRWQGGYGAFSLSKRGVPMMENYVRKQPEHHGRGTVYPQLEPPLTE
jgi:REP element-mobilizing transposase RayT